MKTILLFLMLLLGQAMHSIGQDKGHWSIGLDLSPYWDGLSTCIYVNRHISNRLQIGIMPLTRFYKYTGSHSTFKQYYLGMNLNTRYYMLKERRMLPYLYSFGGYIKTFERIDDGSDIEKDSQNNYNFSVGLGTQYKIGLKGWSIDMNIGYLWFNQINGFNKFHAPFYSFGIFKQLGMSNK